MKTKELEAEIQTLLGGLNSVQKEDVLNYLRTVPHQIHSTKLYKRKKMRQIRQALDASY
ncbi:MAG: hypothetical protein JXQ90_14325 [Cyclobacteriaceae bacterium]